MYSNADSRTINDDAFKEIFKYYKSNKPQPSLSQVLSVLDNSNNEKVIPYPVTYKNDPRTKVLGLKDTGQWNTFTFQSCPGLLLVKNPFTSAGQRYWIRRCLKNYPRKPNKSNIDFEMSIEDWWKECFRNGDCDKKLQKKMRWSTLGYHHNWDTKIYSDDNKSSFPLDLAELTDVVATYLGFEDFKAEAAIVNYYHMDSTLSPHTDHSEVDLKAPLFSFSFGQSAIFLIGGKDKSVEPTAIELNSGDIVIMSKEARLCYHAVPKILPARTTPWREYQQIFTNIGDNKFKYISQIDEIIEDMSKNSDPTEWSPFEEYIEHARINVNVRQVLKEKQKCLNDANFNQEKILIS